MGKQVGVYIQKLRQQEGFTIRQLGERIGLSHGHISMIERGQREVSINTLYQIIQMLNGDFARALCLLAIDSGVPEEALPKQLFSQIQWPAIVTNSG